jgi:hypothetical protein
VCNGNENITGNDMPKRLHDTGIWRKRWFMELSPIDKLAVLYIFDECDCVGVWDANYKLADFNIGQDVDWKTLPQKCNRNIEILENGKWWICDFCFFQYGNLENIGLSKLKQNVIANLERHGLLNRISTVDATVGSTVALLYKDKDKEKEKDKYKDKYKYKDKDKEKEEYAPAVTMTKDQHGTLIKDYGVDIATAAIDKLSVYKMSKGKKYKSDYHAILNWVIHEVSGKDRQQVKAENINKVEENARREDEIKDSTSKIKEVRAMGKMKITELREYMVRKENGTA